ncbi:SGNH/GDSL hydrolase family protein [Nanoarchaeota archaeon]
MKNTQKIKEFGINILFLLVVILVLLVFFEIALRVSYNGWSNFNSEMWRYSIDVKKISDIPNVSHEHQPKKSSILYGVEIKTNSLGFRDKEYNKLKSNNSKRILVLGDSVTLGWGVKISDAYSEVLESLLNNNNNNNNESVNYEVMNSAVGNYNTEMEVNMLKQYIPLDFDSVIVGFFPNDAEKTHIVKKDLAYQFKSRLYLYPFLWDRYVKIKFLLMKGSGDYSSKIHEFYSEEYGGREVIKRYFSLLNNIADENNLKVYIVMIPQFYNEFSDYDSGYIHDFIEELCDDNNFTCIDTLDDFNGYNLSEIIISREDAHPNKLGHRLIAERIYEVMKNEK